MRAVGSVVGKVLCLSALVAVLSGCAKKSELDSFTGIGQYGGYGTRATYSRTKDGEVRKDIEIIDPTYPQIGTGLPSIHGRNDGEGFYVYGMTAMPQDHPLREYQHPDSLANAYVANLYANAFGVNAE